MGRKETEVALTESDQPWVTPPRRLGFWRQLWNMPWQVRLAVVLVVGALLVAAALAGPSSDSSNHIDKAQYDQWRAECEQRATDTLDTSLYTVGGNHWVDEVNKCLVAKAND